AARAAAASTGVLLPGDAHAEYFFMMRSDTARARSKEAWCALHAECKRHNRRSATSQCTFARATATHTSAIQAAGIHQLPRFQPITAMARTTIARSLSIGTSEALCATFMCTITHRNSRWITRLRHKGRIKKAHAHFIGKLPWFMHAFICFL